MRRAFKHALLVLAPVLLARGFAACGEASSSASSTAVSTVAPSTASTTPVTTSTSSATTTTKPAAKPRTSSPASGSASSGSSGGAASFRAPRGDNSIPDFGSEARASEQKRAAAALAAYLRARAGGDWSRACSYLAVATRGELERLAGPSKGGSEGCGMALAALSHGGGRGSSQSRADPLTAGVAALRVRGKSAFALFHGPNNSKYVMPMISEGGAWKMSQLAPLPYPLGTPAAAP
jgi:hypothetical protein